VTARALTLAVFAFSAAAIGAAFGLVAYEAWRSRRQQPQQPPLDHEAAAASVIAGETSPAAHAKGDASHVTPDRPAAR